MTNQWHMPTTDRELPAGTKLGVGDGVLRELLEPCSFAADMTGALGIVTGRRHGDRVNFSLGCNDGRSEHYSEAKLEVYAVLLPEPSPIAEPSAPTQWHMPTTNRDLPAGTKVSIDTGVIGAELQYDCELIVDSSGRCGTVRLKRGGLVGYLKGGTKQCFAVELEVFGVLFPPAAETRWRDVAVGQRWHGDLGGVIVVDRITRDYMVHYHWLTGMALAGASTVEEFTKTFTLIKTKVTPASPTVLKPLIVAGQKWRHRSSGNIMTVVSAGFSLVEYDRPDGSRGGRDPVGFMGEFELVTAPPADPLESTKRDIYAEHRETLVRRLTDEHHLCRDEDPEHLVATSMADYDNLVDPLHHRSPHERLLAALTSERPRPRPHPHEGRSERVYQKRLKCD